MALVLLQGEIGRTYEVKSGRRYIGDDNGLINVENPDDIADLERSGCLVMPFNWGRQIHEGLGGGAGSGVLDWTAPPLHQGLAADQNVSLSADAFNFLSRDASLRTTVTITNATAGDTIGIIFVVQSVNYPVAIALPAGVTNYSAALALGNAINDNEALSAALLSYAVPTSGGVVSDGWGYRAYELPPIDQTTGAGATAFDFPFGPNNSIVPIQGQHTTVTITGSRGTGTLALDGGPTFSMERVVPGYTPTAGDFGPQIQFLVGSGAGDTSVIYAFALTTMYDPPGWETIFSTLNDSGALQQTLHLKSGAWLTANGVPGLGDNGPGSFSAPLLYANEIILSNTTEPGTPAAGTFVMWVGMDSHLYVKGPNGTKTLVAPP